MKLHCVSISCFSSSTCPFRYGTPHIRWKGTLRTTADETPDCHAYVPTASPSDDEVWLYKALGGAEKGSSKQVQQTLNFAGFTFSKGSADPMGLQSYIGCLQCSTFNSRWLT